MSKREMNAGFNLRKQPWQNSFILLSLGQIVTLDYLTIHAKCNKKQRESNPPGPWRVLLYENRAQCRSPFNRPPLHSLQNLLLELALNLLALLISAGLAVKGQQSTEVELGRLEELDLADVNL